MNYFNQNQAYGRQMGRQMPYHNNMQMQGNRQFQGGYQNNFRLPNLINQGNQFQGTMQGHGMNPMNPMGQINPMSSMNQMNQMNPMNPMSAAQQPMQPAGPVAFEPYNPAEHVNTGLPPAMGVNSPAMSNTGTASNSHSSTISGFIQGEGNAFRFYTNLSEFARDTETRSTLSRIADNAGNRKLILGSLYSKMTGAAYTEKDVPIMKCGNLRHSIKEAIEIENNVVKEMSDLYDQIENGMHLKSLNSVIQKKIVDIIALQQLAIYNYT
ncbi:MAG: hypothetical protein FWE24_07080 [Defluviitaleaceae bacterium]|nr:hypothetical protein [Defluviitaleaceae bacterium]